MIHYHGTPCGATREDVARFLKGRHALISFYRPEDIPTAAEVCQSFCIDNGAFSAWKAGGEITDWEPYYRFVEKWSRHPGFDWFIIPDVIDGTEEENEELIYQMMTNYDFDHNLGVPVWHLHESIERLAFMAETYPRICIGSSGKFSQVGTVDWWSRIRLAMNEICDNEGRPKTKIHGLRMLNPAVFTKLPLASADSTNAVRNSSSYRRFGQYQPPNASTRMSIIAERIESHQSSAVWVDNQKFYPELF